MKEIVAYLTESSICTSFDDGSLSAEILLIEESFSHFWAYISVLLFSFFF